MEIEVSLSGNIRSTWGIENFIDRTKRKSRRRSEKVNKMGGSESKATVLEYMIKILKKGFGGDYGVKMKLNCLRICYEVERPSVGVGWPPEGTTDLKNSGSCLYNSHRRAGTPRLISIY